MTGESGHLDRNDQQLLDGGGATFLALQNTRKPEFPA